MLNYTIIDKKLNIDNYIKKTTSDLKQQIRTSYICSKSIYLRGLKIYQNRSSLKGVKGNKTTTKPVVLKAGLNFGIFLRLKVHVLRAGRSSWSLFCSFCKTFLNSLSTSSWQRSESLVRPDSTKASLYEQRGKMICIARFCTPSSSLERYTGRPS